MEENEYKKMIIHRIFSILKKNDMYDIIINKLSKVTNPRYHNYIGLYDLMVNLLRYYKWVCDNRSEVCSYFFPFMYMLYNNYIIGTDDIDNMDVYNKIFWEDDILYNWFIEHVKKS